MLVTKWVELPSSSQKSIITMRGAPVAAMALKPSAALLTIVTLSMGGMRISNCSMPWATRGWSSITRA